MKKLILFILLAFSIFGNSQIVANQLRLHDAISGKPLKYIWVDPFVKTAEWEAIESYANSNSYALPTNVDAFDTLIKDLKSEGIWQKLDVFYVFVGDGSNGFKLINLINPELHYANAYGGLTWLNDGLKGNGSNGYIDTNFNVSLHGVKFIMSNASVIMVNTDYVSGSQILMSSTASGSLILSEGTGTNRLNSSHGASVSFSTNGFKGISRDGSTKYTKSSLGETSYTDSPNSLLNSNSTLFRHQTSYSNRKAQCLGLGGYLSYAEMEAFRTVFNNFLTSLGLTPIA